ncbi:MAG: energy-coupling factor ABC transporter permease [Anaerolineae bacterium]|nr:energy-coupling factor ABC transporter permease [Anaerolineae bacterium]MDW8101960.1 energy-coupling factor ABC transporter permease [Anaerolineae bacterium]
MHIPDGFLNVATAAGTYVVSAGGVAYSLRRLAGKLGEKQVPMVGVMAAFIFAAQMLNFPVAGGTSGHLVGGALAAILLGPWTGLLVMACVLIVQTLIFQDGGITALGANILNMGIIAVFLGYFVYRLTLKLLKGRGFAEAVGGFVAGWVSIFAAAVACALELAISGTSPLVVALPAMAGIHALIGVGEGLITALILGFVKATRPDLLALEKI